MKKMLAKKKPVEVEVVQFLDSESGNYISRWAEGKIKYLIKDNKKVLSIETLEGVLDAQIGDYIIKGVKGEFYPVEKSIFEETYDIVK